MKRCSIDSTPRIEWAAQRPRAGVTGWDHVQGSRAGSMRVARSDLYLRMGGVITMHTLRVKRICQLVVRLKANKCYQELLCYLSFYINNITDTTPGVVLIVLLVISLRSLWPYCWLYCFDRIALAVLLIALLWLYRFGRILNCITLIVLFWPYCWLHCFDRIALAVLLIVSLWLYRFDRIV